MPTTPDALNDGPAGPRQQPDDILDSLRGRGIRPGTATIQQVLHALGDPHLQVPLVLVAGTNGKGSTAALLAAICRAAGQRTGLFTSPAVSHACEQIRIDDRNIEAKTLAALLTHVIAASERLAPGLITAFEAMTAAAFLHFARSESTLAIVEVGLGGRQDATNVATEQLGVLTSVGRDHEAYLGSDLAEIAREKAGIFRVAQPAVIGWLPAPAQRAAQDEAERIGALPRLASREVRTLSREPRGLAGQLIQLGTDCRRYALTLPLLGAHQAQNLALAVLAAESLEQRGHLALDAETVSRGVAACRWPGRLEAVEIAPQTTLLIDAAHNLESTKALSAFLRELALPFLLVFGAFRDKPTDAMLDTLATAAHDVLLAPVDHPRSWDPQQASRVLADNPARTSASRETTAPTTCFPSIAAALTHARTAIEAGLTPVGPPASRTPCQPPMIVACGSLRVVAETKRWLLSEEAHHEQ